MAHHTQFYQQNQHSNKHTNFIHEGSQNFHPIHMSKNHPRPEKRANIGYRTKKKNHNIVPRH